MNSSDSTTAAGSSCDFAVVGAGILGLAVARTLQRRNPSAAVVVLEREREIAAHQTSHNSGVIHAGLYYRPGSLKATLCRQGADAIYRYCDERGIATERCGKLVIARTAKELHALDELEHRARANGVPGLARLRQEAIAEFEPHAKGVAALHSPSTGVVDFGRVAASLAEDVREQGGVVITGCGVHSARPSGRSLIVRHDKGELRAGFAVFCAGAWSDRLALRCGARLGYRIVPFRGAYLRLKAQRSELVRGLIYPVPDPRLPFLGVHISRHIDGSVTIGPTALPVFSRTAYRLREVRPRDAVDSLRWPGTWRMARRWWRTGMTEIADAVSRRTLVTKARAYLPALALDDFNPHSEAGIRAQAVARDGTLLDDFVFAPTPRALHVCNAPSPAATASLALAEHIVDVMQRAGDQR
ncbi:MAG TPA: L-2-hydroxyglutarate oxidase [Solirubrobacteraceae bacterium]|nr:L-2-hydroxyglutarate oxidase [Solirubrobacteraceae bacterium]